MNKQSIQSKKFLSSLPSYSREPFCITVLVKFIKPSNGFDDDQ